MLLTSFSSHLPTNAATEATINGPSSISAQVPDEASIYAEPTVTDLQEFDLLSADEGWVLVDQHLYWTRTGGQSWDDITPPDPDQSIIRAVSFLDTQHGWLILTNADASGFVTYAVAQTDDCGNTWQITPLSLFQPGDVSSLAGAVYLHFIDTQTGWLVLKRATSSNFSVGALFKTTDGGDTWTQLTIPIGEPVYFATSEIGWTAGGAAGDELYRTQDGGQTWYPQTMNNEAMNNDNQRLLYQLPTFEDAQAGVLPVVIANGDQTRVEFYVTDDGGQSWNPGASVSLDREIAPGTHVPLTVFDTNRSVMIVPNSDRILSTSDRSEIATVISQDRMTSGINELDMVTPGVGWAKHMSGSCVPVPQTDGGPSSPRATVTRCTLEVRLLRTEDGGQTWTALSLPRTDLPSVRSDDSSRSSRLGTTEVTTTEQGLGDRTQTFVGQGFDKCEVASLSQLQSWITNSPYRVVNLYIGGSSRACANSALTASFVSQLGQQGWKFIPTWVGPQAACTGYGSRMSYNPTTAYNQGVSEASAAIDVVANLGLTLADESGTIIYYDLEYYDTGNTACHDAAKAFVSGWSGQLRAQGNQTGVYSNGPPLSGFASISNVPDAIWPAHWIYSSYNANATVWNVYSLSNDLWANHQRIRQYTGGHNETWGGVTLNIDCNVIDGVVANTTGDGTPPTTSHSLAGTSGAGGWYVSTVQVTLSASDSSGGSGVKLIQYKIDAGNWHTYSGSPFTVSGDGNHTVYYKAQDNAGNWESEKQVSFKIDVQAPSNPTSVNSGCSAANNIWQNTCNDFNFTWSGASDGSGSGSGVKDYGYYWGQLSDGPPVTYTSDNGFDPPAVPGPVAVRYLRLSTRDNVGHESQAVTLFALRYDASVPTATMQINDGAQTTNQTSVLLDLSAGDTGSGVADVRISNNGITWSDWQPYARTVPWTLPALDRRTLPVYIQVRDRAGNQSEVVSDTVTLDLYPPMPHSANYRICADVVDVGGSVGISSTNYSLVSAIGQPWATGAISGETGFFPKNPVSGEFSERAGFLASITGCLPISYVVTSEFTMTQWVVASGGNLRGSTSYRLGDTAGQPAASGTNAFTSTSYTLSSGFWANVTGTLPARPPDPPDPPTLTPTVTPTPSPTPTPQPDSFGVSINDGVLYTNDPVVMVRTWAPNVTHLRISNDGGFAAAYWQTYQVTTTWVISTYGSYVMPRVVYAQFKDAYSTIYGTYMDDIIYDPVAPEGQVSILGSETATVTLWLEAWDDNSGVDQMRVADSLEEINAASWQPYTNTLDWVPQGDAVYAQFQDRAGNLSPTYGSDGSVYDPDAEHIYLPLILRNN